MKQWSLTSSEHGGNWTYADLSNEGRDIRLFVGISPFQETTGDPYSPEDAMAKAVCHVFVELMPQRALPELVESLTRVFDFYREVPSVQLALRSPDRQLPAKIGRTYERPHFELTEE